MNPWHIIQKVDKAAGWPTLRKRHDTILLAQAELKNWRAMKNHRQQSDPENQESGPKANQGGSKKYSLVIDIQSWELLNKEAHSV